MSEELEIYRKPLTATEIKEQIQTIQSVMAAVMKKDVHYGTIPGTPKPTLYKPGSEKILSTFHIASDPREIEDLSSDDEIRYRVKVFGVALDGTVIGVGVGEASSNEEKYKWRKPICNEEFEETAPERKREVWKKYNNKTYKQKQVRMNSTDIANTILKMAKKRAQIDMTLTATAASDVFDQDLEDMDEATRESLVKEPKEAKPPMQEPKAKAQSKKQSSEPKEQEPQDTQFETITKVSDVRMKDGKNKDGKPYTLYIVKTESDDYITFSETFASIAKEAKLNDCQVIMTYSVDDYGNKIETIEPVIKDREPGIDDE